MRNVLFYLLTILLANVFGYSQTTVTFTVEDLPQITNQKVGIRGNIPPLDWSKSIVLKKEGKAYTIDINFPASEKELEFKFVLFNNDKKPTWENTQNRTLTLEGDQANQISHHKWNREQIIDISTLGKIDIQGLKKDFEFIKTMVLNVHPGTYRYNSKDQILSALEELKDKFSSPITYQEAYLAISKLTAQLKCDHTKPGFNNQGKVINSIIHYQADKVPFTFRWVGEEMVILQNASKNELLQRGTKVLSINQVPVTEIRNEILKYIGADGATDKNRIYKTQVNGYDFRYNAFDIFYPLLYPLTNQKISLEIQQPNQEDVKSVLVSTLTREGRFKILTEHYETFPKSRDDMWSFKVLSDNVAILTLNSFGLNGWKAMTIDYKTFLANAFKQIDKQKIDHLIIDIRENTGGNDEMAEELFNYLANDNYNFEREGRTRYVNFPESLKPHIRTWGDSPWYFNLEPENKKPINGYYVFKENFSSGRKKSNKKVFKGKSYLLTSAANTSLAFYTAYRFKYQNIGMVIGQETGGNLNDINGGQIVFLTLPNSGIEIDFPVMGGFSTEKQPDTGVIPNIETEYKIQDIIDQTDIEVKEVMRLIN
ncbi:S41 family peptidase [Aquimarina sp. MMG016]|uniref:S41 family peptidase n=1 Tax=Aquimarina sp. MMG016 TaxID=2822690 RepID=UPI001B39F9D2|nr:S41 family peptidase [Aquimarina sp. MMG016]MBQ4820189.1 hypothetical protein [Aquimarina sp. MMG016]